MTPDGVICKSSIYIYICVQAVGCDSTPPQWYDLNFIVFHWFPWFYASQLCFNWFVIIFNCSSLFSVIVCAFQGFRCFSGVCLLIFILIACYCFVVLCRRFSVFFSRFVGSTSKSKQNRTKPSKTKNTPAKPSDIKQNQTNKFTYFCSADRRWWLTKI